MGCMRRLTLLLAILILSDCSGDGTGPHSGPPAAIVISPDSISMQEGHTLQMYALVTDSSGDTLSAVTPTWTSSDTTLVRISGSGLATAVHYGRVELSATVDSITGSATVRVLVPVATIAISPLSITLVPGGTLKLTATLFGEDGSRLSDRDVSWIVNGTNIQVTPDTGMVRALAAGQASVKAYSEGKTSFDSTRVTVSQPLFTKLVSGEHSLHTCGVTAAGKAYCWGWNVEGTLGNGTFGDSIGLLGGSTRPTGVQSLTDVRSIGTGGGFTCALEGTPGPVFCWGAGDENKLGNGSLENRSSPYPVLTMWEGTAVAAGAAYGCLLTTDSVAYCWGGTQQTPIAYAPIRKYRAIFAGSYVFCGITGDSLAYCGPVFAGTVAVSPTLKFTSLSIGDGHICGIAADSTAYCWGQNNSGQLGDSTTTFRGTPTPVARGYHYQKIAAGGRFTCGIVSGGSVVHCWGDNQYGQLGRSGVPESSDPVGVSGSLSASELTAGQSHACAIGFDQRTYCWGWNYAGQLGDGTRTDRSAPVPIAGQQ